jgi:ABC-2 type transport system permease protein
MMPAQPPEAAARLAALARHDTRLMLREPGPLLSRLLMPLVLILLMRPLYVAALARDGTQAGTVQVVTGMLVMFSLLALSVVGTALLTERSWHTWDRLRATPARTGELLAAKALPALGLLITQQAELLAFGVLAFGLPVASLPLLAVAVGSWALALLGLGSALGATLRSQSQLNAAYDIGGVVLTALGGALVPLATLPGWARAAAPASPGYWAMSALGSALRGEAGPTLRAAAVLLAVAVLFAALAAWRVGRGWPRSRLM